MYVLLKDSFFYYQVIITPKLEANMSFKKKKQASK